MTGLFLHQIGSLILNLDGVMMAYTVNVNTKFHTESVDAIVVTEGKVKHDSNVINRFYEKVYFGDCWIWNAAVKTTGYGAFSFQGKNHAAHRISYQIHVGEIKEGLYVLHKCDNRLCVNPDHLFLGTHQDNMEDMNKKGRHFSPWAGKTHCKMGHEFTKENTYIRKGKNGRQERVCRTCNNIWKERSKEKK